MLWLRATRLTIVNLANSQSVAGIRTKVLAAALYFGHIGELVMGVGQCLCKNVPGQAVSAGLLE